MAKKSAAAKVVNEEDVVDEIMVRRGVLHFGETNNNYQKKKKKKKNSLIPFTLLECLCKTHLIFAAPVCRTRSWTRPSCRRWCKRRRRPSSRTCAAVPRPAPSRIRAPPRRIRAVWWHIVSGDGLYFFFIFSPPPPPSPPLRKGAGPLSARGQPAASARGGPLASARGQFVLGLGGKP